MTTSLVRLPTEWRTVDRYPESWKRYAACEGDSPTLYDNDDDRELPPRGVRCGACPVRDDCFNYAMIYHERGVWGGTTDKVRRIIRRRGLVGDVTILSLDTPIPVAADTPTSIAAVHGPSTSDVVSDVDAEATCPSCGGVDVETYHHRERCVDCGLSWPA